MDELKVRIPPLPREKWTDEAREVFAFWGEPDAWEKGSRTNILMVMANHPKLGMAYNHWGKHFLIDSTLPPRPRELVVMRTSWHLKAAYEWHFHVGYCLNLGMTLDEIKAIVTGPDAPNWNDEDAAVLRAVDELFNDARITDATWAALAVHFETQQLMDLVFTVGQYTMTSWAIAAFGIQLEDWTDKIDFNLDTASGKPPAVRYKPGETEDWSSATD
jgi:4-carboxymuconolactone decarboxylase